ncbi:hypothetical protein Droror1_Dr00011866 [Drosera rotundifolia]
MGPPLQSSTSSLGSCPQRLRTLFFNAEKKRLSDGKQGLLTSYILVLSLHFDEFKTDPTDIAKDLRTNYAILRKDYEKLGCKFTRENNKTLGHAACSSELLTS